MADRVRFELFCSVSVSGNLDEPLKVMMAGILVFEGDDGGEKLRLLIMAHRSSSIVLSRSATVNSCTPSNSLALHLKYDTFGLGLFPPVIPAPLLDF